MAGLVFILFTLIIATFGYWIAPDNTTNADLQTLEILAKPAGFTQQFLLVKNPNYIDNGIWQTLLHGKNSKYNYIPINNYYVNGNRLLVEKYVDDDTSLLQEYSINAITNNHPEDFKNHFTTQIYR